MQPKSHTLLSPVLYFPHGGGPLPLLADAGHSQMVSFLQRISTTLGTPSAILVISAHWEEERATITGGKAPALIYDYHGFPEESYEIQYPAQGEPDLARRVHVMLREHGIESRIDDQRGFDHGLFVPLKLMFPRAEIPCIQLSLVSGLDPAIHLRIGKAIAGLRKQNVLILGSGFSFHNMRAFFSPDRGFPDQRNEVFQQWLIDTCTKDDSPQEAREQALVNWESVPSARYCHPREEHLLPLHVCFGIAGTTAELVFDGYVLGKRSVAFLW